MAKIVVTNYDVYGAGSFRDAVDQANATAGKDTIVFAKSLTGATILFTGALVLTNEVVINGDINRDGDADITIDVRNSAITNVSGNTVSLLSLVLTNGGINPPAAGNYDPLAIYNAGTMTVGYCDISNNGHNAAYATGQGQATIVNIGTMSISQTVLSLNSQIGHDGANGYVADGFAGGSAATVINTGTLTLDKTAFVDNYAAGGDGGAGTPSAVGAGFRGGDGGDAAGALLNLGFASGTIGLSNNVGFGGAGGVGGRGTPNGLDGNSGGSASGVLNAGGGTSSLALAQLGTMAADTISLGNNARFSGLGGGDTIYGGSGSELDGGAGNDIITTREFSTVMGGLGNDTIIDLFVNGGYFDGGAGKDTIDFSHDIFNNKTINLGGGSFSLFGGTFINFENVVGSRGHDNIIGNNKANILKGMNGNDTIEGGRGADRLDGGKGGFDTVSYEHSSQGVVVDLLLNEVSGGDAEGDVIKRFWNATGSAHDDILKGNRRDNVLMGGDGEDILRGSKGDDRLDGGDGMDLVSGGNGADTFVLSATPGSADVITDFEVAVDTLELSAATFGAGLVAGPMAAGMLVVNATGAVGDADDRLILNTSTGELIFDSDGSGLGDAGLVIATFDGTVPTLTADDFAIV